jgi:hypothetical protein
MLLFRGDRMAREPGPLHTGLDPAPKVCSVAPDDAGRSAGGERLLSNRSADLCRASSSAQMRRKRSLVRD